MSNGTSELYFPVLAHFLAILGNISKQAAQVIGLFF